MEYNPDSVTGRAVEASINLAAKRGAVYVGQSAPGVLRLQGVDGPMDFGGRMFAKDSEGKVVEVENLQDLPFGANLAITDKEGNIISHGTMQPNGAVEVYGTDAPAMEKLGGSMADMAAEIPRSIAAMAGVMADQVNEGETAEALQGYADDVGAKKDAGLWEATPAAKTRKMIGRAGLTEKAVDTVVGSSPFLLAFGTAVRFGNLVGKAMRGAPFANNARAVANAGRLGGASSAVATNAMLNAGFTVNDVRDELEKQGVPPEQQRQLMNSSAFWPAVVSGLTAMPLSQAMMKRQGLDGGSQAFREGITETAEELTQAQSAFAHAGLDYDPLETAGMAFLGGYFSELGHGVMGDRLSVIRQYPRLMKMRHDIRRMKGIADGLTGGAAEVFDADKEFFKRMQDISKWGGRRDQVMGMTDYEVQVNFGKYFDQNKYTPDEIKDTVMDAADAFATYMEKMQRPDKNAFANIQKIAQSDTLGATEAQNFIRQIGTRLGIAEEASDEQRMSILNNFVEGADEMWRQWRINTAMQNTFGGVVNKAESFEDAVAAVAETLSPQDALARAGKWAQEITKMQNQNILDETTAKAFVAALGKTPFAAMVQMGLINPARAAEAMDADAAFARRVAERDGHKDAVAAYDTMMQPPKPDAELLARGIARAEKIDATETEQKQSEQKPPPEGGAVPTVPAVKTAQKKAYQDAMKQFATDMNNRMDAGAQILGWWSQNGLHAGGIDAPKVLRDEDERADIETLVGILAKGVQEEFISSTDYDMPPEIAKMIEAAVEGMPEPETESAPEPTPPPAEPEPSPAPEPTEPEPAPPPAEPAPEPPPTEPEPEPAPEPTEAPPAEPEPAPEAEPAPEPEAEPQNPVEAKQETAAELEAQLSEAAYYAQPQGGEKPVAEDNALPQRIGAYSMYDGNRNLSNYAKAMAAWMSYIHEHQAIMATGKEGISKDLIIQVNIHAGVEMDANDHADILQTLHNEGMLDKIGDEYVWPRKYRTMEQREMHVWDSVYEGYFGDPERGGDTDIENDGVVSTDLESADNPSPNDVRCMNMRSS